jgi:hypothetical protein
MLLQRLKVWLSGAGVGATVALVGAIALGPRFVAWRWEPPDHQQLSCAPEVRTALGMLVTIELWTAAVGALLGIVIAVLLARRAPKSLAP